LGICLGMQVMARKSFEKGEHNGLGWFDAEIVQITPNDTSLKVPQIGWNEIIIHGNNRLFEGIPNKPDFYFVHSYHMKCNNKIDVIATCEHGMTITAAIARDNIYATQFHPEKSQTLGLKILNNFIYL